MSASNPETNVSATTASQSKPIAEPIYTYTVSWKWLLTGLLCAFGLAGIAGAAYYVQHRNLPTKIVAIAQNMVAEADLEKEKAEQTGDSTERRQLRRRSQKLRVDAANLLNKYRQANPERTNEVILGELYNILESLYNDPNESSIAARRQRGDQLRGLALELIRTVDETQAIPYRTRLLELAWDRRDYEAVITHGKELFAASQALGETQNYDAMRYIAMALFDWLPARPYDPTESGLPPAFSDTMDALLEKLNSQRPDDIEIAKRYAEFLVSVGKEDRSNFTASASESLQGASASDRFESASHCIDEMVRRNADNPDAYLTRYQFHSQFSPGKPANEMWDATSDDLQKVLELAPGSYEGLILSALHALRQAGIASDGGEPERAEQWENEAGEYLRRTVRENPNEPLGYQYLGEYLLLHKKSPREAIDVWSEGLKNSSIRGGNEELICRLIILLLQQGMVEEAKGKLSDLTRIIDEMRVVRPGSVGRTREMQILLTGRLHHTEANLALAKIEDALRQNRPEEARRWYGIVQQRQGDAVQEFEKVLMDFGRNEEDYIIERRSVYYSLLPQSLLQLGQLKLDMEQWDSAASYFNRALRFNAVLRPALLGMSIAFQQSNQLDRAERALQAASTHFPDDLSIRYRHAMVSFRSKVGSNATIPSELDDVQKELESLESFRSELPQPWILDMRLIHLGIARANLSNQADTILAAMTDAVRKFRALEKQTFPPDAEGNTQNYIDDPAFVAELIGLYSSLAARADFDRLLERLREFPDGEDAYFEARVNDALRRDSRNEAVEIIDEAVESPRLSSTGRERFVALLQTLKGESLDDGAVFDRIYTRLKTTFDENPESLRPQAFFQLAKMSLDTGKMDGVQQIRERLERIEGPAGTNWRYIAVRQMLAEADPDYSRMRELQEEIVRFRPGWDEAYLLSALIDEQYLLSNPEDTAVRNRLITAYRNATECGNVQPEIWSRLSEHLEAAGRSEEARTIVRNAALRGVILESRTGQLPEPFGRMYSNIQKAIANEDAEEADTIARQCIRLAEMRGERPELIFTLHLTLGKVFLDASMFPSAIRHLSETAQRGSTYVYPLALCVARSGDIDGGFALLLDEIDTTPSAMRDLLPAVLVLLAQVQPSEAVYDRIDSLMERIQRGERLTLKGTVEASDEDHMILLGTKRVNSRKIQSLVVRFRGNTENLDTGAIQFIAPEEFGESVEETETE